MHENVSDAVPDVSLEYFKGRALGDYFFGNVEFINVVEVIDKIVFFLLHRDSANAFAHLKE